MGSKLFSIGRLLYFLGDNMDKWKELGKRKKFWVVVGAIAVIAIIGSIAGWWGSPEAV
jgi:flagellar biosynthesis/type III secretory pathway M-ring protein FliF/YscJ